MTVNSHSASLVDTASAGNGYHGRCAYCSLAFVTDLGYCSWDNTVCIDREIKGYDAIPSQIKNFAQFKGLVYNIQENVFVRPYSDEQYTIDELSSQINNLLVGPIYLAVRATNHFKNNTMTITQEFKAHVADMMQDVINEIRDATPEQIEYLRVCMNNRLTQLGLDKMWQPIFTAPMDGTVILGKWEDDPDPRPQKVKYAEGILGMCWFTPAGFEAEDENNWVECTSPSHWQPIN